MALAHIRNGQIIRRYDRPLGWVNLEDGSKASPPVAGFVSGNDKIVEIVEEVTDTSAGGDAVRVDEDVVEATRVVHLVTIRDKTTEEIEVEATQTTNGITESDEMTVAMAVATVRLVMAARDGLLAERDEAFVLNRYKAEILDVIRKRRGLL